MVNKLFLTWPFKHWKKNEAKLQNTGPLLKAYVSQVAHQLVSRFRGLSQAACQSKTTAERHVPKPETQKRNHRNETTRTAETTETPELNNGNVEMKLLKHRNRTTKTATKT